MNTGTLHTTIDDLTLVPPNIERDAVRGVIWLAGPTGRNTLELMGVAPRDNKPTTLAAERKRVAGFISNQHQLNWMINYADAIVGSIWVDLITTAYLDFSPSIHLMIGDPAARGKGIGQASLSAVMDYLKSRGMTRVYTRYIRSNIASEHLQIKVGFRKFGQLYKDEDGLEFQNTVKLL